jgi:hypothetical protein
MYWYKICYSGISGHIIIFPVASLISARELYVVITNVVETMLE